MVGERRVFPNPEMITTAAYQNEGAESPVRSEFCDPKFEAWDLHKVRIGSPEGSARGGRLLQRIPVPPKGPTGGASQTCTQHDRENSGRLRQAQREELQRLASTLREEAPAPSAAVGQSEEVQFW